MSVLIKGMEMPTSCGYCPVRHEAREGDECYLGASLTEYQKRPDDCPLVSVPPHGDLIDRDALINECMKEDSFLAELLFRKVSNAPTIIPAEEVIH